MARQNFSVERGLRIYDENSDLFIDLLSGAGAPPGTSGKSDEASIGSLWADRSSGDTYRKVADTSSASDWEVIGNVSLDELKWRNEKVRAATNDTVAAGTVDPTGFSDNESGLDGNDFAVGEYLIGDVDGTPALFEVTAVNAANDITVAAASSAIADNNTFVVQVYLPDSGASQEVQAIIHFPLASGAGLKIGDLNWNFADGIELAAGYAAASGDITAADTVQTAIQKLDGNVDALTAALGISQGDVDFGSFVSPASILFSANQTAKQLFQRIGNLLAQLRAVSVSAVTTQIDIDAVPHASVQAVLWLVEARENATPANREAMLVYATTDGVSVDHSVGMKLNMGAGNVISIDVDISGGDMRLLASSSTAGARVIARRLEVAMI